MGLLGYLQEGSWFFSLKTGLISDQKDNDIAILPMSDVAKVLIHSMTKIHLQDSFW